MVQKARGDDSNIPIFIIEPSPLPTLRLRLIIEIRQLGKFYFGTSGEIESALDTRGVAVTRGEWQDPERATSP